MKEFTKRQRQIIKVSIELIAENGIQAVTIKNLSKKIGIAESAIYRHFESKMDILLGILEQFRETKMQTLNSIHSEPVSAIKQLEMIFLERFRQFTETPALTAVIFSEEIFQNDKRLADTVYAIMSDSQQMIFDIIKKGQSDGFIRTDISTDQLSLTVVGALRLIVAKWRLSGFAFDLQTEGQKLWNAIKKIIEK